MFTSLRSAAFGGALLIATALHAQTTAPAHACLDSLDAQRSTIAAAMQQATQQNDPQQLDSLVGTTRATAAACLAHVTPTQVAREDTPSLGAVQALAGQYDASLRTFQQYAADTTVPKIERAETIERQTNNVLVTRNHTEGISELYGLVMIADQLHVVRPQLNTRIALASAYRLIPAYKTKSYGLIRDMLDLIRTDPDTAILPRRGGGTAQVVKLVQSWAEQDSSHVQSDSIVATAKQLFANVQSFKATLDPSSIIGMHAAPLDAERWINRRGRDASANRLRFGDGNVYLVEFTAHWCGPCRASYPTLDSLHADYAKSPFRIVLTTSLYGYYGAAENLGATAELDSLKGYFSAHGIEYPIAITGDWDATSRAQQERHFSQNATNYAASSLPTIVLIDGAGIIRNVWRGWSDEIDDQISDAIGALLRAKGS